ncbi:MAG TPA: hypothetical protein VJH03_17840 [Blastocatellia bacterium]|nr:hypothetical protein [Blastocatellia bacterium]
MSDERQVERGADSTRVSARYGTVFDDGLFETWVLGCGARGLAHWELVA